MYGNELTAPKERYRMRRPIPAALFAILAVLALLLAAPLAAYTIYFKDGRTLQTKGKYRIVNGRALVTLLNGTEASFKPQDIDVQRTDQMNQKDLGAAEIIDSGPASRQPEAAQAQPQTRLSDLIASRGVGPRDAPVTRRETASSTSGGRGGKTRAGFPDLMAAPRNPYGDAAVAAELRQFFLGQKAEAVEIYQGSQAGRPLAAVTASSEGSVFRALAVGANALLHVRDRFPGKVEGLELLMVTSARERAGQFVLTPEMAENLVSKRVSLVAFFLDNVQF
jgi:hypothetical protein